MNNEDTRTQSCLRYEVHNRTAISQNMLLLLCASTTTVVQIVGKQNTWKKGTHPHTGLFANYLYSPSSSKAVAHTLTKFRFAREPQQLTTLENTAQEQRETHENTRRR